MIKKNISTIIKAVIQILSFIFFTESFALSLFAIKSLIVMLISGKFGNIAEPIVILAATIPTAAIFGRFYCGYICSFGAMQDFLNFIVRLIYRKIRKKELNIRIPEKSEKILSLIKYAIILALVICMALGTTVDSSLDPWTAFGKIAVFNRALDLSSFLSVGGLLLFLIIVASLFFHRPFCRFFCPMGAIYSLISKFAIGKKGKKCPGNGDCCICRFQCKNKSLNIPGLLITLVVFVLANIFLTEYLYKIGNNPSTDVSQTVTADNDFQDGTFTGSGQGFNGDIDVIVSVEDGLITKIIIDNYTDDNLFINKVSSQLIPAIIAAQSTDVDCISGATYSSRGLIYAVNQALGIENDDASYTEIASYEPDPDRGKLENLEDGIYEGTADGFKGELKVTVTVSDQKVADISIVSYYDTEEYLFYAAPKVIDQIIEDQSLDVDCISGATYSRNGLVNAVADALDIPSDDYDLPDPRPRADKEKEPHHITQKFIESPEQYAELVEKYKDLIFGPDGLKKTTD